MIYVALTFALQVLSLLAWEGLFFEFRHLDRGSFAVASFVAAFLIAMTFAKKQLNLEVSAALALGLMPIGLGVLLIPELARLFAYVDSSEVLASVGSLVQSLLKLDHRVAVSTSTLHLMQLVFASVLIFVGCSWFRPSNSSRALGAFAACYLSSVVVLHQLWLGGLHPAHVHFGWLAGLPAVVGLLAWGSIARLDPERVKEKAALSPKIVRSLTAVLLLGWALGQSDIHTSGDRQLPRVAVDESHSEWSWLDAPYDEDQYGSKTTYNYVALLEMLRAATTASVAQEFSDIAFGEVDVLVVKMPTRRYSSDEREEIWRFVNGGGGLLVIGDHTNVFGTSRHINELLEPTGIQLEFDGVNDSFFHQRQVLSNGFGSTHAATINVPPTLMATSCTLALSPPAVPVRIGQSVYADRGEYSNFSFFGDHTWTLGEPAGRVVQVASEAVGRGQVLVFSDSTIFSTFTFAFPGVWESIANGVVFLRSGNSLLTSWTQQLFRWLCLFGLVLLVARHSTPTWSIVTLAVLIGWQGVANDLRARAFNIDSFSDSRRDVGFLYRGNEFLLPLEHETHSWDTTSYHSMFTRVGRVGRIPRVIRSLDEAKGMRALVLISATQISEREVAEVVELVKSGLDLVLVARADGLVDEKLLEALGIGAQTPINKVVLRGEGSAPAAGLYVDSCVSVTGLDPILTGASRETVVGAKEFGEGSVLYLGVGREYAVDRFGTVKSAPTQRQRQFAELMYQALRDGP